MFIKDNSILIGSIVHMNGSAKKLLLDINSGTSLIDSNISFLLMVKVNML